MTTYLVGTQLLLTVTVKRKDTNVVVEPGTFAFRLRAPSDSAYVDGTYAWNGSIWTNSESTIAVPTKGATGVFELLVTVPYLNLASGRWTAGWVSTANISGRGAGSGETSVIVGRTLALS